MKESVNHWLQTYRQWVLSAGLCGMLIGIAISTWNGDELGWALLRVAGWGACFALAARVLVRRLMRAWLESKIQQAEQQAVQAVKKVSPQTAKP